MGSQLLPLKGVQPPFYGLCLLWPNGWMDQDATWYGGKPRPRRRCVRWCRSSRVIRGHSPPVFGSCLLLPNGWMYEDATWYGSWPRPRPHCIIRGASSPRKRHSSAPSFRPMSIVAMVAHLCYCWALVVECDANFNVNGLEFGSQKLQSTCGVFAFWCMRKRRLQSQRQFTVELFHCRWSQC